MTMRSILTILLFAVILLPGSCTGKASEQRTEGDGSEANTATEADFQIYPFGEGGQIKMLYDRRQRPQSVYLNGMAYIVFNGGGDEEASGRSDTKPMIVQYNPVTREFSDVVTLGPPDNDHHYGPVIWADTRDRLHVLYGCHSSPGTHLVSKEKASIGSSLDDWEVGAEIAPSISYPTAYRVGGNRQLIYYRTQGHISSWTYRISDDNGKTWVGPENDVTDLDSKGRFEWSSYQCKFPSEDGRYLHVVYTAYDDNRKRDSARYYNPRYKKNISNEWKYNLYYVKVDLETEEVTNFDGGIMDCPIDLDQANARCRIWDTEGRGAGIPPDIVLDENGDPAFLHVLSEETTEQHNYYFVHRVEGEWKQSVIAPSNHQWNSCHVGLDDQGIYHAYLVVGDTYIDTKYAEGMSDVSDFQKEETNYLNTGGYMDKHGGGRIEEWISFDKGTTWELRRDLTPDTTLYPGWRYNNVQAVTNAYGTAVDGLLMYYGWKDKDAPAAKGFLVHEGTPQRYVDRVFDQLDIQKDIVFGEAVNVEGEKQDLLLDIYSPAGDDVKNRPAMLLIHGGGFRLVQDKSQSYIVKIAREFAQRGYVCVSINYRVRANPKDDPEGPMSHALEDAMRGLNWLRESSDELGVDKSRIVVGGGSAGGMIAVNLCYKDEGDSGEWDKSGIVALVDLWGSPWPEWNFYKVAADDPPAIIVHGTDDTTVSYNNSLDLVKEMESLGLHYELVPIEGAGHTPQRRMDIFAMDIAHFLHPLIMDK